MTLFDPVKAAGLTRDELDAYWMPYTANRAFKDNPRMVAGVIHVDIDEVAQRAFR